MIPVNDELEMTEGTLKELVENDDKLSVIKKMIDDGATDIDVKDIIRAVVTNSAESILSNSSFIKSDGDVDIEIVNNEYELFENSELFSELDEYFFNQGEDNMNNFFLTGNTVTTPLSTDIDTEINNKLCK